MARRGTQRRGRGIATVVVGSALALGAGHARADDYPARPVHVITQAAGSSVDLVARLISQQLAEVWGQQIVVDNRPGANGIIALQLVARAKPDGYMLAMTGISALTINPFIYKTLPFRPIEDFAPVTQAASFAFVAVVTPAVPVRSLRELVALARQRPGELNYSSSGIGNLTHLVGELFCRSAGVVMLHVPNKGDTPALMDVLSGQTQMMFSTLPAALPLVQGGKLRALAVLGAARSPDLPDVPTAAESGYPDLQASGWGGIVAPAGTPPAIVDKLQREIARQLDRPAMRAAFAQQGAEPVGSTPAEFGAFIAAESAKWSQVVEAAGLTHSQ
jgi:tripartite-type tricarboxylate transporter receptor subunit TctC